MMNTIGRPLTSVRTLGVMLFSALAATLVLAFAVPAIMQAQPNGPIKYAENGTDPVATFTGVDPEGRTVYWSILPSDVTVTTFPLDGNGDGDTSDAADIEGGDAADDAHFSISASGVLSFKSPPDFENKQAGADGTTQTNTYKVVVVSSDDAPGATTDGRPPANDGSNLPKRAYYKVTVTVADVDEDGSVSLSHLQPQVDVELTATPIDDDAEDSNDAVDGKQIDAVWKWEQAATPDGPWTLISGETESMYTPAKDVDGKYLRATATYTDKHGSGKTAMAVSANPVRLEPSGANSTPVFPDGAQQTRKVKENSPFGTSVGKPVAAGDAGDILIYSFLNTADAALDNAMFDIDRATGQILVKGNLNAEAASGDRDTTSDGFQLQVTVRATDPWNNETNTPNFADVTVTITVEDVNEAPVMTVGPTSDRQAENEDTDRTTDGIQIPTLIYEVTDVDSSNITWSLQGDDKDILKITKDATARPGSESSAMVQFKNSPNYEKPTDADTDNVYMVTVVASDSKLTAKRDLVITVTNADDPGRITFSSVQPKVRIPFIAELIDEDGVVDGSVKWQWHNATIDPTSADALARTAIAKATSDTYTPKDTDATSGSEIILRVRATYTDSYGSTSTMDEADNPVTVNLDNAAPEFKEGGDKPVMSAIRYIVEGADSDDDVVADPDGTTDSTADPDPDPVTATDPNPADTNLTYHLGGADEGSFALDQATGQITVKAGIELDYEKKKSYMVTVTATDPSLASATIDVTIFVVDVNEGPEIAGEDDVTKDFRENSTSTIQTFSATDPERRPVYWSLKTTDSDYPDNRFFTISANGALSFLVGRDFEAPADGAEDNTYKVVVIASDDAPGVGTPIVSSERKLTVQVTDVRETGTVTVDRLVPQVGVSITASLVDGDATAAQITGADWKWYRGGTAIVGATSASHSPTATGSLRVEATYTAKGDTRTASRTISVRAAPTSNVSPTFQNDTEARSVDENRANAIVGAPIRATDTDRLTYSVSPSTHFSIDNNGQLRTKVALDHESPPTLSLTVTATDPSDVSDTVTINVSINDANEAPRILTGPTRALPWPENKAITEAVATYTGIDPDGSTQTDNLTWSLSGPDATDFNIGNQTDGIPGTLTFKKMPDYEMPAAANNVYRVTVEVSDGKLKATRSMTVEVTDVEEDGKVRLSTVAPKEAVALTAFLTDSDGGVTGKTWQWEHDDGSDASATSDCSAATGWAKIDGATSESYTPKAEDLGKCLRATVKYTDRRGAGKSAMGGDSANAVLRNTDNRAPAFKNQPGKLSVLENKDRETVVGNIQAADPNSGDKLTYRLTGPDAALFDINSEDDPDTTVDPSDPSTADNDEEGQITTRAEFDHEAKSSYMVTVTATDPNGLMASHDVTITIKDDDEAPEITLGGLVLSGPSAMDYAENGAAALGTYNAAGPAAAAATWTLEGDDAGDFVLEGSGASRMLKFRSSPDFESPADADTNNTYMVTVKASDGTYMDTHAVTVRVTNADEDGMVTISPANPLVGTPATAMLVDSDGGITGETWQWAKSMTMGGTFTDIDGATSESYTALDADDGYYLKATVSYTDAEDSGKTAMSDGMARVTAGDPLVVRYDANADGEIERSEVITAINEYLDGGPNAPTRADVIRLINIYLDG